jgi:hypothetical protein
MTSMIHLEAVRNRYNSPTDLNLGQKKGSYYYLLRRIISSEAIIQSHSLLRLSHTRLVRFSICQSDLQSLVRALPSPGHCFGSLPPPCGRRVFCFGLTAALRVSAFRKSFAKNAKHFPNLPKMHSLALGGGSLASLRVVCPGRLQ